MTKKLHIRPERAVKTALVYLLVLLVSVLFAFPCICWCFRRSTRKGIF